MTKQEQIEEMKTLLLETYVEWLDKPAEDKKPNLYDMDANKLYNAGYRKIPENAVVLTKEEYDKLGLFEESVQEYKSDNGQLVLVKERKTLQKYSTDIADFIRKETAKEIFNELIDSSNKITFFDCRMALGLDKLAKQYGVEVEE